MSTRLSSALVSAIKNMYKGAIVALCTLTILGCIVSVVIIYKQREPRCIYVTNDKGNTMTFFKKNSYIYISTDSVYSLTKFTDTNYPKYKGVLKRGKVYVMYSEELNQWYVNICALKCENTLNIGQCIVNDITNYSCRYSKKYKDVATLWLYSNSYLNSQGCSIHEMNGINTWKETFRYKIKNNKQNSAE